MKNVDVIIYGVLLFGSLIGLFVVNYCPKLLIKLTNKIFKR